MTVDTPTRSNAKALWWLMLIRGVIMTIFGVLILIWPGTAALAFVLVFGVYALADGFAGIAHMIRLRQWTLLLTLTSIVSIGAGIIALVWPVKTAIVLLFIIAFWALTLGVLEVVAAIDLRRVPGLGWGWVLVSGLASIVLGVLLLINPLGGAIAMLAFVGIFTIFSGLLLIGASFALRSAFKQLTT